MSVNRYFTSTAIPANLSAAVGSSGNPSVNLVTGLPASYPFFGIIDLGTYSGTSLIQEVIQVTSAPVSNGDGTWTIPCLRGQDGTTAQAHSAGATFVHGFVGMDGNDAQAHYAAASGIHGIAGSVVGTTDSQTLTNKILTGGAVTADPVTALGISSKQYVDAAEAAAIAAAAIAAGIAIAASITGRSVDIATAGFGLKVAEGSNAKQGTLTLNGTTAVVVANTSVTANSRIFLTNQTGTGTVGAPYISARVAATSFSVKSTVAGDTGTVAYFITEPG